MRTKDSHEKKEIPARLSLPEMILFDRGGTLCYDLDYDPLRATRALLPYAGKNPKNLGAEELYDLYVMAYDATRPARRVDIEIPEWTIMRLACGMCGIELDMDEETFERVFRLDLTPVEMTPHIDELLDYLNAAGFRTGVVSNTKFSGRSLRERQMRLLPRNRFEFYVSSADLAVCKPNKMLFDVALASAELPANKIWYCGDDFRNDVLGAHGAGMFPVLYDVDGSEARDADFDYLTVSDWRELIEILQNLRA